MCPNCCRSSTLPGSSVSSFQHAFILGLKSKGYRDGIYKKKRDKIGMRYESLAHNGITQCAMPTSPL